MAFSRLYKYSDGAFPEAGTATDYTLCENISSYLPYDIGDARGAINAELDKITALKNENTSNIGSLVSTLEEEWGKKFISIDGNGLDFVQSADLNNSFSKIDNDSNSEMEKCKSVVESVESGLSEVKEYVNKLQQNLEEYNKTLNALNSANNKANNILTQINNLKSSENPDNSAIDSLNSTLSNVKSHIQILSAKIEKYKKISEPDGQWIVQ